MANRGEISKAKAEEWAHETPDIKKLPEHKKKAAISPALEASIQASPEMMRRRRAAYDAYQKGLLAQKSPSKWFNPSALLHPPDVMEDFTNLVTGSQSPMLGKAGELSDKAENVQEEAKKLHGIDQKLPGFKKSKGLTKKTAGEIALSILQKVDLANRLREEQGS